MYWRDGLAFPQDYVYGPGESAVFREAQPTCWWMPRLFSRRGAELLRFDERLEVAEDHLLVLDALRLHQRGEGRVWCTRSSDIYCIDRSGDGRTQTAAPAHDWGPLLAERVEERHRSSPWELPVLWSDPLLTVEQKAKHCAQLDRNL